MSTTAMTRSVVYDRLCRTLDELIVAARRCAGLTDQLAMPDMDVLADTRWALTRAIIEHVSYKGKYVYDALEQDPDPGTRAKARALRESQQALHAAMHKHMTIWSRPAVEADWAGFRRATRAMHKVLFDRIALEQRDLHPMVHRAESRTDPVSVRNWARIAWDIRESVYKT